MKIAIIISKNTANVSQITEELSKRGAEVCVIFPETDLIDVTRFQADYDLYVIKSVGHLGLGLAGALHAAGAKLLNPFPAVSLIKNKVAVTQVLHSAGVPVPETFTSTDPMSLVPILRQYPLIAKPFDGNRGKGIQIIRSADELMSVQFGEFLMAQRYCEPDEPETFIKAYYLDGRIFLRKRVWASGRPDDKQGIPVEPSPDICRLIAQCAECLDLKLFGLDIVMSQRKPYVVDVQEFGSFSGVPNAAGLLADFIIDHARNVSRTRSSVVFHPEVSSV